jgi:hypothetical protein
MRKMPYILVNVSSSSLIFTENTVVLLLKVPVNIEAIFSRKKKLPFLILSLKKR